MLNIVKIIWIIIAKQLKKQVYFKVILSIIIPDIMPPRTSPTPNIIIAYKE
jgi:hypothetical protein